MTTALKRYDYVGPANIRASVVSQGRGVCVRSREDLQRFVAAQPIESGRIVLTFVVDEEGTLRVAARRSEHVACAGGKSVLAAGEIECDERGAVVGATNQSTGYCPEPASWSAVQRALDDAGIPHPGGYTRELVFRRCASCGERNIVRDAWFVCALCDAELPAE